MSRFSDIQKGTAAIKPVEFPLVNVPAWGMTATPEQLAANAGYSGPTHAKAGARVLSPGQLEIVLEKSIARAKSKGASEGSDLYNFALQLYTCAMGYVDLDSDPRSPVLYFGDTIDDCVDVLSNDAHISRDTLVYLCEQLDVWRDWCNPQGNGQHSEAQAWEAIERIVGEPAFPLQFGPAERLSLMHTMAVLLVNSRMLKSESSAPLSANSTSESKPIASVKKTAKKQSKKRR